MAMKPRLYPLEVLVQGAVILLSLVGCMGGGGPPAPEPPAPFPPPPEPARFFYERTIYGTADVETATDEDRLRAVLTGTSAKKGIPLSKPFDVAVHQGRVFVSDTVSRSVFAMDFPSGRTFQIGKSGDYGGLGKPLGLAVDRSGNLFVVDNTQNRVVVFDRNGKFRTAFGGKSLLDRPTGIDVSQDGTRAYVVDVGGVRSEKHRILVFDTISGDLLSTIGKRGKNAGELNLPRDVAMGPNGNLYVTDGGNFRVQVFTQDGKFVREWGKAGMRFGQFSRPKGIAIDLVGNVYVIDAAFGNFQIFNPEGQLLLFIGRRNEKNGQGVYMLPAGIDIDEDGRIYVIDQYFRKLEIIRPANLSTEQGHLAKKLPAKK